MLDQTQFFSVFVVFLLHVGINVPTQLQLDVVRMTGGPNAAGRDVPLPLGSSISASITVPEPLNSVNCLPTRFTSVF